MSEDTARRQDRLAQIRQQIADGTYETEEKLNRAVERLLLAIEAEPEPAPSPDRGIRRPR